MAKLVTLIETTDLCGQGVKGDPVRRVRQWFTTEGELVVEDDPCLTVHLSAENYTELLALSKAQKEQQSE